MNLIDALLDVGPGRSALQNVAVTVLIAELERLARYAWQAKRLGPEDTEEAIQDVLFKLVRGGARRHQPGKQPCTNAEATAFLGTALRRGLVSIWRKKRRTVAWLHRESEDGKSVPMEYATEEGRSAPDAVVGVQEALGKARRIVFVVFGGQSVRALNKQTDREGRQRALDQLEAMYDERLSRDDLVLREMHSTGKTRATVYSRVQKAHRRARRGLFDQYRRAVGAGDVPEDLGEWVDQIFRRLSDRQLGEK